MVPRTLDSCGAEIKTRPQRISRRVKFNIVWYEDEHNKGHNMWLRSYNVVSAKVLTEHGVRTKSLGVHHQQNANIVSYRISYRISYHTHVRNSSVLLSTQVVRSDSQRSMQQKLAKAKMMPRTLDSCGAEIKTRPQRISRRVKFNRVWYEDEHNKGHNMWLRPYNVVSAKFLTEHGVRTMSLGVHHAKYDVLTMSLGVHHQQNLNIVSYHISYRISYRISYHQ